MFLLTVRLLNRVSVSSSQITVSMFELSQQNCCRPKLFSCVSAFLETNSNVPVKYFQGWSVCLDLFVSWCFKPSQPLRITSGLICLDNSNRPYRFDKLCRVFFLTPRVFAFLSDTASLATRATWLPWETGQDPASDQVAQFPWSDRHAA